MSDAVQADLEAAYRDVEQEFEQQQVALSATPTFRGENLALQASTERVTILAGPRDTGKTTAVLWKLDAQLRARKCRAVIVRKVRADLATTTLPTWKRVIAVRGGAAPYGGEDPSWYDYPNGSRCYLAGMDRDTKLLGAEFDYIAPSQLEQFDLPDMEGFVASTSGRAGGTPHPMVMADCNPAAMSHWIRQRYESAVRFTMHRDNPQIYDEEGNITPGGEERLRALDGYTGVRLKRLRYGLWVAAEGTVYEFDDAVHLHRGPLPQFVRRFRAIDFGFSNPFTCEWWGMDGDGRLFMYREIYRTRRLVRDHGFEILRLTAGLSREAWERLSEDEKRATAGTGERIEATVCDHDAEGRATLEELGIPTTPALKDVETGIEAVELRLRKAGDGKARLFVCENALVERDEELRQQGKPTSLIEEFGVYRRGEPKPGKPAKEEPIKENDHGCDTTRYMVMHVDGKAERKGAAWLQLVEQHERKKQDEAARAAGGAAT